MSDPFMVKVQRSVMTNASKPTMLIYDKDKNVEYQDSLSKDVKKAMGGRFKVYMWALLHDDGIIELQGSPYEDEGEGKENFERFSFEVMNPPTSSKGVEGE